MNPRREEWLAGEIERRLRGCPEADELRRSIEGELSREERARLDVHLSGCVACREAMETIPVMEAGAPVPLPEDVVRRSEDLIRATLQPAPVRRPSLFWPRLLQVAALFFFAGALWAGGSWWLGRRAAPAEDLGALRGGESLDLLEPIGRVETVPERMRWVPLPGAVTYRVVLLDRSMQEIWSKRTSGADPELVLDASARAALVPGGRFVWMVEALDVVSAQLGRSPAGHFEIAASPAR